MFPKGKKQSEESNRKRSETLRGRKIGPFSEDHKRKLSESHKGHIPPNKGIPCSDEQKQKISKANKGRLVGELNPNYGKDMTGENNPMYNKHHSEETKKKQSLARLGKEPWNKGKTGLYALSEESRLKISKANKGREAWNKGIKTPEEVKQKISKSESGQNHYNWQGGISKDPYPFEWEEDLKESIRKRDNYTCQLCGKPQEENKRRLPVHHISYLKENIDLNNLISLCNKCHGKTSNSKHRQYWTNVFNFIMAVKIKKNKLLTNNL